MARAATARLKVNAPLGHMPALQYLLPAQLEIDQSYQRDLATGPSQGLIRRIAQFWNWDLCQPLVVARREDGALFVIDGQHRLEAARLRGDIMQLPAVVLQYTSQADEAASFVHLNQQRRPLSKLDIFKAAVASEDPESLAITAALREAGLAIAATTNADLWKPGELVNIGGIERAWRRRGAAAVGLALRAVAEAFDGQVLRYAGTLFPGIVAVCADEMHPDGGGLTRVAAFTRMLGGRSQADWRKDVLARRAENIRVGYSEAVELVMREAWAKHGPSGEYDHPAPNPKSPPPRTPPLVPAVRISAAPEMDEKRWCAQCEARIHMRDAVLCKSRYCKLRPALVVAR